MGGQYHEMTHFHHNDKSNIQEYLTREAQVQFILAYKARTKERCNLVTYSLAKALKKWEGRAFESAYSEMEQLHDRDCFDPIDVRSMSASERKKAMTKLARPLFVQGGN